MQITSVTNPVLSPLVNAAGGADAQSRAAEESRRAVIPPAADAADKPAEESSDIVSVSAEAAAAADRELPQPAPVYAEIWKGAMKVAQVDIHGHVTSMMGVVAGGGGGTLAGPLLAAQRAVQVAQQVGGEIRSAGQSLDGQTLMMRARLAQAYR